jgi:hypothetical protein
MCRRAKVSSGATRSRFEDIPADGRPRRWRRNSDLKTDRKWHGRPARVLSLAHAGRRESLFFAGATGGRGSRRAVSVIRSLARTEPRPPNNEQRLTTLGIRLLQDMVRVVGACLQAMRPFFAVVEHAVQSNVGLHEVDAVMDPATGGEMNPDPGVQSETTRSRSRLRGTIPIMRRRFKG